MQVEFLVENIENLLPTLSKILPLHSQIPVLSNLLIEATENGFFISATNLEMGVRIKIPAKIEELGAITIPGKQFIEAISSLPKDKVTLSQDKENVVLKSRDNRVIFQTIPREEFPTLFEEKGEKIHIFKDGELIKLFSKIIFAVSLDESRPELTGVYVVQKEDYTDFVATDGFRLSLKRMNGTKILEVDDKLIFPAKIIAEVMSIKSGGEISMYVYKKNNQVIFEIGDTVLIGRLISGDFPNYEKVVPASSKTQVVCDREDFTQKLRLSSIFARDSANIVKLKVEDGKIKIFSKSTGLGEGEAVLDAEQEGEDNEIAFNVKFISDLLKNITSKTIRMELLSSIEPAVFKTDEDRDFVHIIMPVRVQE